MNKLLIILIGFICLNYSNQLDCGEYTYSSACGLFNTDYKFQCFMSETCEEVKVEKGCKMNQGACEKEGNDPNVQCFLYDHEIGYGKFLKICKKIIVDTDCEVLSENDCRAKENVEDTKKCIFTENKSHCKIYDKTCADYKKEGCGNLAKGKDSGTNQCYYPNYGNCMEVLIDEFCYISSEKKCDKRKKFNETLYKCDQYEEDGKPTCKRIEKKCGEQTALDKCQEFGSNCYKANLYDSPASTCNEVEVITKKCKIDSNGDCVVDEADTAYETCEFYIENNKNICGPKNKQCTLITSDDKCNKVQLTNGYICTKVKDYSNTPCLNVLVDQECQINNNGECTVKTQSNKNKCQYENSFSRCKFYEIDNECEIEGDSCKYYGEKEDKKCDFIDFSYNTKCKLRDLICNDFTNSIQCDGDNIINRKSGRKCSWHEKHCKEYKIDDVCTVTNADGCIKKTDKTLSQGYKCLFTNTSKLECIQKQDSCESYYESCSTHDIKNQIQCINNYSPNCKKIQIDQYCEVTSYGCNKKSSATFDEEKQKCDFLDKEETICKLTNKTCNDFSDSKTGCNKLDICAYITPYNGLESCYVTETKDQSKCKIVEKKCVKEKDDSIKNYETCEFIYDGNSKKAICEKRTLECKEINDPSTCNSIKVDELQCHYSNGKCLEIINDEYCNYNNDGLCTYRSGNPPSNYYCEASIDDGHYYCLRKEKLCSSIRDTNECNSFTPVDKQCFYIQDDGMCKNIKVDSQCKINDEGKCTGNGCAYDDEEDKNHCAYKDNDSSILKLERFLLLVLFLIF